MQIKIFTVPLTGDENAVLTNEINSFLRSHRILNVTKQLVANSSMNVWTFCIEYIEGSKPLTTKEQSAFHNKVAYKDVLSEEEFSKFRVLREARKTLSKEAGVPAYAILVDKRLVELCKTDITKLDADILKKLDGFGEKKFEKFGQRFIDLVLEQISSKA